MPKGIDYDRVRGPLNDTEGNVEDVGGGTGGADSVENSGRVVF